MKNIYIIREGALAPNKRSVGDSDPDPDKIPLIPVDGEYKYLHELKPEFFRWTGSRFENVFVGVCTINANAGDQKIVVYSLPKYFPKERCDDSNLNEIKRVLKQICLVAEKLKKEHSESAIFADTDKFFEPYTQNREKNDVNRVALAEFLLEDYVQNGLYVNDIMVTKKNGLGRTSWAKTVLKTMPIIQDGNIVYLDRINREHNVDEGDIIRKIHAEIISQCLNLVGPLQPGGIVLDVDGMYDQDDSFDDKRECYAQEINMRIPYVFREREINLFKAMEAWCRNTKYYDDYIGVTHFDRLWEWVNDSVWGNISSKYTKSDNPKYYIDGCDGCFSGLGSAIPDTIRVETGDNGDLCKKKVYVFDAKYYVLKALGGEQYDGNSNVGEACGWPANSDIAKQIEYLELLRHLLQRVNTEEKVQIEYKNAFLLPECTPVFSGNIPEKTREKFSMCRDDWYKKIGHVEQGKFNELLSVVLGFGAELEGVKARTVDLIIVKPETLYDYYLSGKKISSEELKCIWEDEKI